MLRWTRGGLTFNIIPLFWLVNSSFKVSVCQRKQRYFIKNEKMCSGSSEYSCFSVTVKEKESDSTLFGNDNLDVSPLLLNYYFMLIYGKPVR